MSRRDILMLAAYQGIWVLSALSAAAGLGWPGPIATLALVAAAIAMSDRPSAMAWLIIVAAAIGLLAETALQRLGLVRYAVPLDTLALAPPWIVALWAAFATTLNPFRRLLSSAPIPKAALVGAGLAPFAYLAGERLGALSLQAPRAAAWIALAAIWGAALPCLLLLQDRLGVSREAGD